MAFEAEMKELNELANGVERYTLITDEGNNVIVREVGNFASVRIQSVAIASKDEKVVTGWLLAEISKLKKKD